jgi:hypothetical protein
MSRINWSLFWATFVVLGLAIAINFAHAKNSGQWSLVDPEVRNWYESLKQPDNPAVSCCGEADSYFCDEHAEGDQVYCIINDDRNDEILKREHVDNGTRINIPPNKINHDPNMAGHGVVFLSRNQWVYCFIGIGGV